MQIKNNEIVFRKLDKNRNRSTFKYTATFITEASLKRPLRGKIFDNSGSKYFILMQQNILLHFNTCSTVYTTI